MSAPKGLELGARGGRVVAAGAYVLLILALVLTSRPRRVGDGLEYVAMGLQLSRGAPPTLSASEAKALESKLRGLEFSRADFSLAPDPDDPDGRRDFTHFWFYSLLAVPMLWLTAGLGLHPNHAFTFLNGVLLAGAFVVAWPRLRPAPMLLLFVSPVIWWIDKAHPEAFVFALLVIGFAVLEEAPHVSLLVFGLLAAQNPAFVVAMGMVVVALAVRRPRALLRPVTIAFVLSAAALPALHAGYYLWRLGTVSVHVGQARPLAVPTLRELGAVVWDPNVGLLFHLPFFALALVMLAIGAFRSGTAAAPRPRSRSGRPVDGEPIGGIVAAGTLVGLLLAFPQTDNFNHGGTPGVSRYALWLLPLSVPVLRWASRRAGVTGRQHRVSVEDQGGRDVAAPAAAEPDVAAPAAAEPDVAAPAAEPDAAAPSAAGIGIRGRPLQAVVALSAVWSLVYFHPRVEELYWLATRPANALWTHYPGLYQPLPEIFAERAGQQEPGTVPVATHNCTKVLLKGGEWPMSCPPLAAPPPACCVADALCYANYDPIDGYRFRSAPRVVAPGLVDNPRIWPLGPRPCAAAASWGDPEVRELIEAPDWRQLRRFEPGSPRSWIEATEATGFVIALQLGEPGDEPGDEPGSEPGAAREAPLRGWLLAYAAAAEPGATLGLRTSGSAEAIVVDPRTGALLRRVGVEVGGSGGRASRQAPGGPGGQPARQAPGRAGGQASRQEPGAFGGVVIDLGVEERRDVLVLVRW